MSLVRIENQRMVVRWSGRRCEHAVLNRLLSRVNLESPQIMIKHRELSPECPFVVNPTSSGNIPINSSSSASSSSDHATVDLLNEQCRLATFRNWPVSYIWIAEYSNMTMATSSLPSRLRSSPRKHWPKQGFIIWMKRTMCVAHGAKVWLRSGKSATIRSRSTCAFFRNAHALNSAQISKYNRWRRYDRWASNRLPHRNAKNTVRWMLVYVRLPIGHRKKYNRPRCWHPPDFTIKILTIKWCASNAAVACVRGNVTTTHGSSMHDGFRNVSLSNWSKVNSTSIKCNSSNDHRWQKSWARIWWRRRCNSAWATKTYGGSSSINWIISADRFARPRNWLMPSSNKMNRISTNVRSQLLPVNLCHRPVR